MSLENMKDRLQYLGGAYQQDRMVVDKLRSMRSATKYSYQAAAFEKYPHSPMFRGLFNSASQTEDRDTKKISCEWNSGVRVGDIVHWKNMHSLWIVFLQDRTELAYFHGSCRRCDYTINWVDKDRHKNVAPVAVIGPTNPSVSSGTLDDTIAKIPTGNLVILASDNLPNREFFTREQTFLLKGKTYKISQIDNLSMPGVIQMNATEYFNNRVEDDPHEDLRNKWNVQPVVEHYETEYAIDGPRMIKPMYQATYSSYIKGGIWKIKDYNPKGAVQFVTDTVQQEVTLVYNSVKTGNFTLEYHANGKVYSFNVIVESMM